MKIPFALAGLVLASSGGPSVFAQSAPAPSAGSSTPAMITAAPPAPAAAVTPERLAAAQQLMQSMRFATTLQKVLDARKESMVRMIDQSTMMMPPGSASPADLAAYKKDMLDTYSAEMTPDKAIEGMAKVYASVFTVEQLKGLSDFYASPAGQALVDKTFELQQKSGEVLQTQMQNVMPKLQAKQKAFVAAHPAPAKPASPAIPPAAATPAAPAASGSAPAPSVTPSTK